MTNFKVLPNILHDPLVSGLLRQRDKLKSLCAYDHNTYGYRTWWGVDIQGGATLRKVKKPFDHAILQGHVKYWICYISTVIRTKACKFGRGDLLWDVSTHKVKQPFEWTHGYVMSSDKWSTYLQYHNAYGYQTWQGGYIQWEASFKPTRPINHMILWFWFSLRWFVSSVTQMPASSAIVQRVGYCARSNTRDLMFNIFAEQ